MNINKSYFDIPKSNNEKENIDLQKIQHFTLNTFSKNNNTQETIWNFDIKFGYVDTMYENIPLYENSRINPENQKIITAAKKRLPQLQKHWHSSFTQSEKEILLQAELPLVFSIHLI